MHEYRLSGRDVASGALPYLVERQRWRAAMTPTLPDAIARVERLRDFYNDDRTLYSPSDKADMAAGLTRVLSDVQRLREALTDVRAFLWCSQCGQWVWEPACGPTHAMRLASKDELLKRIAALLETP